MKKSIIAALRFSGYEICRIKETPAPVQDNTVPVDIEDTFMPFYEKCKDYSVTSIERMYALFNSVKYIVENQIPGDIVECGIYKGGSMMLIAMALKHFNDTSRNLYLYDTYTDMTKPTEKDVDFTGASALEVWWNDRVRRGMVDKPDYPFEKIQENMFATGYRKDKFHFIKGKVEDTLPGHNPGPIALLRLDTDWYESTYHELVHLYPLLVKNGILIIDDYGHFKGAREAVEQYFQEQRLHPLLHRLDYTGRLVMKI